MKQVIKGAVASSRLGNKADAAEFFDVNIKTIDKWIRKGAPVVQVGSRGKQWTLDLCDFAAWHFGRAVDDQEEDPDNMPAFERKAWYDGEYKKRDLQIRDRDLIESAELEAAIAAMFSQLSQNIQSIPDNLERRHGVSPAVAVQVEEALLGYLDVLADELHKFGPAGEDDE